LHDRTAALYAFCRVSDDAVDLGTDVRKELARLHERLDRIYAGKPEQDPVDRAFCRLVQEIAIPQTIPAALLDGFAWDAERRQYPTQADLEAYCARVPSTVGVMMTLVFGARSPVLLARADRFYRRADGGMSLCPRDCRLGVRSARPIHAEIGHVVARNGCDSVSTRAYTSKERKLLLLLRALPVLPWSGQATSEPAAPAVKFLVDAVAT